MLRVNDFTACYYLTIVHVLSTDDSLSPILTSLKASQLTQTSPMILAVLTQQNDVV